MRAGTAVAVAACWLPSVAWAQGSGLREGSDYRRLARPVCLTERVTTSGRRWEQRGVWRTIVLMWRLRWAYWRGVPAERLAEAYR